MKRSFFLTIKWQAVFHLILAAALLTLFFLPVIGAAADALYLDRNDGKRRLYHAVNVAGLMVLPYCAYVYMQYEKIYGMLLTDVEKMGKFELFIASNYSKITPQTLLLTSLFFVAAVLVSYLWRDLYYLDAAVSLIPLVYFFYLMLTDGLFLHPAFILTISFVFFGARLAVMLSEPPAKQGGKQSINRQALRKDFSNAG